MKKIIIFGAICALSTSAIASDKPFYGKISGFGSIANKILSDKQFDDMKKSKKLEPFKSDLKNEMSDFGFGGSIGFGYRITDIIRTELQFSYFGGQKWNIGEVNIKNNKKNIQKFDSKEQDIFQIAKKANGQYIINNKDVSKEEFDQALEGGKDIKEESSSHNIKTSAEASGFAGFLNIYADFVEFGSAKLYAGGGVGASYMSSKTKVEASINGAPRPKEHKSKEELTFAWNIGGGIAFAVSPDVTIDVGYSFVDLGKPVKEGVEWDGENITTHNVNVGVRFNF
jgi:opacity protein-like surface antigen